jgi:uncharacterized membrane protein
MVEKLFKKAEERVLHRLMTFTDCLYALGLVLIIQWLPMPGESSATGGIWLLDLFAEFSQNLIAVFIGVVFIVLYWIRSNHLLNHLERSNGVHVAFSMAQVFFILMLLYVVRVSGEIEPASARAGESAVLILTGLFGALGWRYAANKSLVRSDVSDEDRKKIYIEAYAEPLAALVTLPFAFVGELVWNLAWLAYIPIARFVRARY